MNRPRIFCHMLTSLDGKIMGRYMDTAESEKAGEVFDNIAFGKNPFYKHQGWLSGRVTTDDNFTFYKEPNLKNDAPQVPEGDFVARKAPMYYVSIDPSGRLGWESHTISYGGTNADVIEVLTGKASNAYKVFLREMEISYIIAGEDALDIELLLSKLKSLFGIELLMLGGGAVLNWSFIQSGVCDELSLVIAPVADGSTSTQTLFMTKDGLSEDIPVGFKLIEAKVINQDVIWLRYRL